MYFHFHSISLLRRSHAGVGQLLRHNSSENESKRIAYDRSLVSYSSFQSHCISFHRMLKLTLAAIRIPPIEF